VHGSELRAHRRRISHLRWRLWRHGFNLRQHRSNAALPRQATGYMLLDAATKRVVAEQLSLEDAEKWVEEG
jgi:hypothetical protein